MSTQQQQNSGTNLVPPQQYSCPPIPPPQPIYFRPPNSYDDFIEPPPSWFYRRRRMPNGQEPPPYNDAVWQENQYDSKNRRGGRFKNRGRGQRGRGRSKQQTRPTESDRGRSYARSTSRDRRTRSSTPTSRVRGRSSSRGRSLSRGRSPSTSYSQDRKPRARSLSGRRSQSRSRRERSNSSRRVSFKSDDNNEAKRPAGEPKVKYTRKGLLSLTKFPKRIVNNNSEYAFYQQVDTGNGAELVVYARSCKPSGEINIRADNEIDDKLENTIQQTLLTSGSTQLYSIPVIKDSKKQYTTVVANVKQPTETAPRGAKKVMDYARFGFQIQNDLFKNTDSEICRYFSSDLQRLLEDIRDCVVRLKNQKQNRKRQITLLGVDEILNLMREKLLNSNFVLEERVSALIYEKDSPNPWQPSNTDDEEEQLGGSPSRSGPEEICRPLSLDTKVIKCAVRFRKNGGFIGVGMIVCANLRKKEEYLILTAEHVYKHADEVVVQADVRNLYTISLKSLTLLDTPGENPVDIAFLSGAAIAKVVTTLNLDPVNFGALSRFDCTCSAYCVSYKWQSATDADMDIVTPVIHVFDMQKDGNVLSEAYRGKSGSVVICNGNAVGVVTTCGTSSIGGNDWTKTGITYLLKKNDTFIWQEQEGSFAERISRTPPGNSSSSSFSYSSLLLLFLYLPTIFGAGYVPSVKWPDEHPIKDPLLRARSIQPKGKLPPGWYYSFFLPDSHGAAGESRLLFSKKMNYNFGTVEPFGLKNITCCQCDQAACDKQLAIWETYYTELPKYGWNASNTGYLRNYKFNGFPYGISAAKYFSFVQLSVEYTKQAVWYPAFCRGSVGTNARYNLLNIVYSFPTVGGSNCVKNKYPLRFFFINTTAHIVVPLVPMSLDLVPGNLTGYQQTDNYHWTNRSEILHTYLDLYRPLSYHGVPYVQNYSDISMFYNDVVNCFNNCSKPLLHYMSKVINPDELNVALAYNDSKNVNFVVEFTGFPFTFVNRDLKYVKFVPPPPAHIIKHKFTESIVEYTSHDIYKCCTGQLQSEICAAYTYYCNTIKAPAMTVNQNYIFVEPYNFGYVTKPQYVWEPGAMVVGLDPVGYEDGGHCIQVEGFTSFISFDCTNYRLTYPMFYYTQTKMSPHLVLYVHTIICAYNCKLSFFSFRVGKTKSMTISNGASVAINGWIRLGKWYGEYVITPQRFKFELKPVFEFILRTDTKTITNCYPSSFDLNYILVSCNLTYIHRPSVGEPIFLSHTYSAGDEIALGRFSPHKRVVGHAEMQHYHSKKHGELCYEYEQVSATALDDHYHPHINYYILEDSYLFMADTVSDQNMTRGAGITILHYGHTNVTIPNTANHTSVPIPFDFVPTEYCTDIPILQVEMNGNNLILKSPGNKIRIKRNIFQTTNINGSVPFISAFGSLVLDLTDYCTPNTDCVLSAKVGNDHQARILRLYWNRCYFFDSADHYVPHLNDALLWFCRHQWVAWLVGSLLALIISGLFTLMIWCCVKKSLYLILCCSCKSCTERPSPSRIRCCTRTANQSQNNNDSSCSEECDDDDAPLLPKKKGKKNKRKRTRINRKAAKRAAQLYLASEENGIIQKKTRPIYIPKVGGALSILCLFTVLIPGSSSAPIADQRTYDFLDNLTLAIDSYKLGFPVHKTYWAAPLRGVVESSLQARDTPATVVVPWYKTYTFAVFVPLFVVLLILVVYGFCCEAGCPNLFEKAYLRLCADHEKSKPNVSVRSGMAKPSLIGHDFAMICCVFTCLLSVSDGFEIRTSSSKYVNGKVIYNAELYELGAVHAGKVFKYTLNPKTDYNITTKQLSLEFKDLQCTYSSSLNYWSSDVTSKIFNYYFCCYDHQCDVNKPSNVQTFEKKGASVFTQSFNSVFKCVWSYGSCFCCNSNSACTYVVQYPHNNWSKNNYFLSVSVVPHTRLAKMKLCLDGRCISREVVVGSEVKVDLGSVHVSFAGLTGIPCSYNGQYIIYNDEIYKYDLPGWSHMNSGQPGDSQSRVLTSKGSAPTDYVSSALIKPLQPHDVLGFLDKRIESGFKVFRKNVRAGIITPVSNAVHGTTHIKQKGKIGLLIKQTHMFAASVGIKLTVTGMEFKVIDNTPKLTDLSLRISNLGCYECLDPTVLHLRYTSDSGSLIYFSCEPHICVDNSFLAKVGTHVQKIKVTPTQRKVNICVHIYKHKICQHLVSTPPKGYIKPAEHIHVANGTSGGTTAHEISLKISMSFIIIIIAVVIVLIGLVFCWCFLYRKRASKTSVARLKVFY